MTPVLTRYIGQMSPVSCAPPGHRAVQLDGDTREHAAPSALELGKSCAYDGERTLHDRPAGADVDNAPALAVFRLSARCQRRAG